MADIILKNVPLAWMDLWKAADYNNDGKFRYNATVLVEQGSPNDKLLRATINTVMTEAYGPKAATMLKAWDGDKGKMMYLADKGQYDFYKGRWSVAAHRRVIDGKPMVLDNVADPDAAPGPDGRRPPRKLTEAEGRPYRGCLVNIALSIYAQTTGTPGLRASFSTVQYAGPGEEFGGSKPATAEGFSSLAEGADAEALI